MKKLMLSAAIVLGVAAAASAQGIEPVSTTTPNLDVTVGTQNEVSPLLIGVGAAVIAVAIIASGDETEGTR